MTQKFSFTVFVEVKRATGKFAGRDEIAEAIGDEIEGHDPGSFCSLGVDGESEYEIESEEVEDT